MVTNAVISAVGGFTTPKWPDIPGLRERWGRDVVHCPYCFGWELRDARLGVLVTGPLAAAGALMWR